MAEDVIRVGIVGANPERGWAVRAHVPALQASPRFAITAVATSRADSARRAAERFGAAHAFANGAELAAHPDVDLVVVSVKVPAHAELVRAALDARKHVWCEWPLARTVEEAEALAASAEAAGVHSVVGLQARRSPAIRHARELIAQDAIGRVTSATVFGARGRGASDQVPASSAYTYDRDNRAGLVEVLGGHALDATQFLLGRIGDVAARTAIQRPAHTVQETGERIAVTAPDHLVLTGRLDDGALVSVHLHDGEVGAPRTRIEVAGTAGGLAIVSPAQRDGGGTQLQMEELGLHAADRRGGGWHEIELPERLRGDGHPGGEGANVARLYAQLADDIEHGTRHAPDFATGARLHRLLAAAERSAATGTALAVAA
jgi:predicted dehydrogenase